MMKRQVTNIDPNSLKLVVRKIRKNANVHSLAQASKNFREVANPELSRRHEKKKDAECNARMMYNNVCAHYEAVSTGEGFGNNNMGRADIVDYWSLQPHQHVVLLERQIRNPKRNIPSMSIRNKKVFYIKKNYANRMRRIRKYPAVYRKVRNKVAKCYVPKTNNFVPKTQEYPIIVN